MLTRTRARLAAVAAAGALIAGSAALAATPASASTGYSITFKASTGSSAGWTDAHQQSVTLKVADTSGYGQINLGGFTVGAEMPTSEPSFTATNYAAGTPRIEIVPSGADSIANDVTGYPYDKANPACATPTAGGMCWSVPTAANPNANNSTYADVRTYIDSNGGIHAVYVVADGSQKTPYTATVTGFSWDGQTLVPAARNAALTGKFSCGTTPALRKWTVANGGNTDAHANFLINVRIRKGVNRWEWLTGNVLVAAGGKITVTTHRGWELRGYWMANGSQPPPHEVGALSFTVAAGSSPAC